MRKIFLAGIAAVCMLMMGMTAFAMEPAVPRRVRAHGACHQQVESLLRNRVRHDCAYADANGDGICDSCGWHQDRHHCVDADGYCLNGACNYENCGYGCGTGYCRGYCNSLAAGIGASGQEVGVSAEEVPAGTAPAEAALEERRPDDQGMAGAGSGSGSPAGGTAQYSDPAGTVPENGGAGAPQGGTGYYGYGHHGSGHHGNGRHGCGY